MFWQLWSMNTEGTQICFGYQSILLIKLKLYIECFIWIHCTEAGKQEIGWHQSISQVSYRRSPLIEWQIEIILLSRYAHMGSFVHCWTSARQVCRSLHTGANSRTQSWTTLVNAFQKGWMVYHLGNNFFLRTCFIK